MAMSHGKRRLILLLLWLLPATGLPAQTKEEPKDSAPQPKEKEYYRLTDPTLVDRQPEEFRDRDIEMPDVYGETISEADFNRLLDRGDRNRLAREGFSPRTHFIFRTHRVAGSNMLCFAEKEKEEVKAFMNAILIPEKRIYLMGRVGRSIYTNQGSMTLFMADKLNTEPTPPEVKKVVEKKPIVFTIEYDVQTPAGVVRRKMPYKFKIPEPGKTYEIPDPYDPKKTMYMTFEF